MKKRKANLKWTPVGNVCAYCRRGIGSEVRIRCAECGPKTLPPGVAAPLHFCVECFSAGVEVFGHSASHKYSVIENASIYPLSKEWTADEELRLLEGVNKFGYGNWVDVAEHVGGGKTRDRAKRHYEKFFLLNAELDLSQPARPGTPPVAEEKTTVHVAGAGAPQTSGAPAAAEAPARAEGAAPAAGGPAAEKAKEAKAAGYLPLRREFDVEWDNDAELLVMDVEFVDGEPADERALKLELLKAYNTTLDERERRRDFVVAGGGLQAARDPHEIERQRQRRGQSKYTGVQQQDERALRSAMRPYAHFQNAETHEQLVRDTQEEAALRRHVAQLRARARAEGGGLEGGGGTDAVAGVFGGDVGPERERASRQLLSPAEVRFSAALGLSAPLLVAAKRTLLAHGLRGPLSQARAVELLRPTLDPLRAARVYRHYVGERLLAPAQ